MITLSQNTLIGIIIVSFLAGAAAACIAVIYVHICRIDKTLKKYREG